MTKWSMAQRTSIERQTVTKHYHDVTKICGLPLRLSGTSPTGPLEMWDTVLCQGRDHQRRERRQIYGISVSLCAFKASSYGCREPGAPFQHGGKDQGKGQSMRHNDLILSHTVTRYRSLTCLEGGQRTPHSSLRGLNLDD